MSQPNEKQDAFYLTGSMCRNPLKALINPCIINEDCSEKLRIMCKGKGNTISDISLMIFTCH